MNSADTPNPDHYDVLVDGPEVELRVKGSRFAGQAFAVASEDAAQAKLETIRKRYHDATHHCSAWVVGPPGAVIERSDDDGEPSGTAGQPILHPLRGSGFHDGLVVVTRWYGGTKLGAGGLVRAYGECAADAVAAAGARRVWITDDVVVEVSYDDMGTIEAILARTGRRVHAVERDFGAAPRFTIRAVRSATAGLVAEITEATGARAQISVDGE